ncbi:MAG TPA: PhaM family polyhydroxyalkanoate granule multifunctional regulatory protein [Noviherbaspirillum sp.]|nr:PhaM family polyhydroxyalkanoate granule multifunctional regulatory protein [Noviherbaspirillum sp.]
MIKPNIPNMPNFPGMGAMTDTLDFVKNLWSGMGIPGMNMSGMNMPGMPGMNLPGMVIPSLSVDEINKKISDMRAVESWLNLNMNMLRSTIQALEVQSATIATLQTMGETFSATMGAAGQQAAAAAGMPQMPAAGNGAQAGNGAHSEERLHGAPEPTSKDQSDAANLTAPLVNATAWWNMLQDQFQQAVSGAMSSEPPATAADSAAPKAQAKPKAKKAKTAASTKSQAAAPATSSGTTRKRKTSK